MSRPFPCIDRWRAETIRQLDAFGRKAELARHLAGIYGGEPRAWEKRIQNSLKRQVPSGEIVLAINGWLEGKN